jgi:hypothetical protein
MPTHPIRSEWRTSHTFSPTPLPQAVEGRGGEAAQAGEGERDLDQAPMWAWMAATTVSLEVAFTSRSRPSLR